MSKVASVLVFALMAATAFAVPAPAPIPTVAAVLEHRQVSFTVVPISTSKNGSELEGASAAAALTGAAAGDLAGVISQDPALTVAAGEAVGTFGPFEGELKGSIYQGGGHGTTAAGCLGGGAGPFGYTQCAKLPVPRSMVLEDLQ